MQYQRYRHTSQCFWASSWVHSSLLVGFDMGMMMGRSLCCAISLRYKLGGEMAAQHSSQGGPPGRTVGRLLCCAVSLRCSFRGAAFPGSS